MNAPVQYRRLCRLFRQPREEPSSLESGQGGLEYALAAGVVVVAVVVAFQNFPIDGLITDALTLVEELIT